MDHMGPATKRDRNLNRADLSPRLLLVRKGRFILVKFAATMEHVVPLPGEHTVFTPCTRSILFVTFRSVALSKEPPIDDECSCAGRFLRVSWSFHRY